MHARRVRCGRARSARVIALHTRSWSPHTVPKSEENRGWFLPGFWEGSRSIKDSKHQRLHDSHPWLQADAHAGQEHVEQPQSLHLAAQPQEPGAQPQLEEQEQAILGLLEENQSREEESERDALKKYFLDDNKHQRFNESTSGFPVRRRNSLFFSCHSQTHFSSPFLLINHAAASASPSISVLHSGQHLFSASHGSRHSAWYAWPH